MMYSIRVSILPAALMLLAAGALSARETAFTIDPAQTKVEYTLGSVLHTVHGTFRFKRGEIHFDPATGQAGGELVVDAASGNSGTAARDRRMNKDVLQSVLYPEIVFRPDRVEGALAPEGTSHLQVHGVFAIHGAQHAMTLPVDVQAGGGQYKAVLHFTVPYIQWGMKNPSTLFLRVNDAVEITIDAVARPTQP